MRAGRLEGNDGEDSILVEIQTLSRKGATNSVQLERNKMSFNHELLSKDDCIDIIKADRRIGDENILIIDYETEDIPGHPGYLGAYMYLDIRFKIATESVVSKRYFMKTLPYHDTVLVKSVEEWGIFRKEADLYGKIFHDFNRDPLKVIKWAPECYLARRNLLVMEDLTQKGFQTAAFQTLFSENQMKMVLDRLAQMHASSFDYERTHLVGKPIGSLFNDEILFETTFTPNSGWFVAGLKGIQKIALHRSRYSQDPVKKGIIQNQLWQCLTRVYSLVECTDEFRSVIVHRDLWFNNIMFRIDSKDNQRMDASDCMLIDFQLARYLPPAVDFLCALYLLTDREHRSKFETTYVEYYYSSLQQKLDNLGLDVLNILPKEQFDNSLSYYRLLGLVWTGVLHGFVNFPKGLLEQLHQESPKTYTRMTMENRDDFIIKYYDCDTYYRARLDDVVTELLEYLFDLSCHNPESEKRKHNDE